MIVSKLDNEINSIIVKTGIEPRIIVMHPQTWYKIIREIVGNVEILDDEISDQQMKYRNYRVLRSKDMNVDEFLM